MLCRGRRPQRLGKVIKRTDETGPDARPAMTSPRDAIAPAARDLTSQGAGVPGGHHRRNCLTRDWSDEGVPGVVLKN